MRKEDLRIKLENERVKYLTDLPYLNTTGTNKLREILV